MACSVPDSGPDEIVLYPRDCEALRGSPLTLDLVLPMVLRLSTPWRPQFTRGSPYLPIMTKNDLLNHAVCSQRSSHATCRRDNVQLQHFRAQSARYGDAVSGLSPQIFQD
jgi:hypothetical protein